jgi:hypothetical protein
MRAVCHRISRSVTENSQEGFYMFRRTLLAFLAIFATGLIMTSPVEAAGGGGGTKAKNGTLRVLGAQANPITTPRTLTEPKPTIGVGVMAFLFPLRPLTTYESISEFQAAGGVIVNPGQVVEFKVSGPGFAFPFAVLRNGSLNGSLVDGFGYSGEQNKTGFLKITGPSSNPKINGTAEKF